MVSSHKPIWETCVAESCQGVRLTTAGECWAHANNQDLDAALKRLGEGGDLDARGVPLTAGLVERILAAAPNNSSGRPKLNNARFDQATFEEDARFAGLPLQGDIVFRYAVFEGEAAFDGATFQGEALFPDVTFEGEASFARATSRAESCSTSRPSSAEQGSTMRPSRAAPGSTT
jgi:hypothetical protein